MKKLIPALIILMALAIATCLAFCSPATNIPTEPTTIITEPTTSPITDPTEPTTLPFVPSPTSPNIPSEFEDLLEYGIMLEYEFVDSTLVITITWTNQTENTVKFTDLYWIVPTQNNETLPAGTLPEFEAIEMYDTTVFDLTFTISDNATPILINVGLADNEAMPIVAITLIPNAVG